MRFNLQHRSDLISYLEKLRTLPDVFRKELLSWESVYKSPHSRSFYNLKGKTWDYTPENSLRISDHWNFKSRRGKSKHFGTEIHCQTDVKVSNNTHWTLARFENDIWHVLQSEPIVKRKKHPLL